VLAVTRRGERVHFSVRVVPRASANEVAGERGGALVVRVTAPPAEGRANEAVLRLLARRLDVPASQLALEAGARNRTKTVSIPVSALERLLLLCN